MVAAQGWRQRERQQRSGGGLAVAAAVPMSKLYEPHKKSTVSILFKRTVNPAIPHPATQDLPNQFYHHSSSSFQGSSQGICPRALLSPRVPFSLSGASVLSCDPFGGLGMSLTRWKGVSPLAPSVWEIQA